MKRPAKAVEPSSVRLPRAVEVTLGLMVATTRAGSPVVRAAFLPTRLLVRATRAVPAVRATEARLAATGQVAAERGERTIVAAVEGVNAAPVAARVLDAALAGPLPEDLARSVVEHRVVERIAGEAEVADAVAGTLERGELANRVLDSPEFEQMLQRVVASPAVRAALASQTSSLAAEVGAAVRRRTAALDDTSTRAVRGWLGRAPSIQSAAYGGLTSRALALTLDLLALVAIVSVGGAVLGLVASLVGELRPVWLVALLLGAAWALASSLYFVLFWTLAGQTPGMRLLHLRVLDQRGEAPGFGRSLLRLAGLVVAIVPLFAGFLPVLVDTRRRGLHDLIAGTVVVRDTPGRPAHPGPAAALESGPG